jgi:hypothetical protein
MSSNERPADTHSVPVPADGVRQQWLEFLRLMAKEVARRLARQKPRDVGDERTRSAGL